MNTFKKFTLGVAAGLAGGAIAGLLTTPRSGEGNRRFMKAYSEDVKRDAEVVEHDFKRLTTVIENLRSEAIPLANQFADEVGDTVKTYQQDIEPRVRRIEDYSEKMQDTVEDFEKKNM